MNLVDILNWRYAAKKMNGEKIAPETLENILDAVRLSVSSGGLQPYNVIVVSNPELKQKIRAVAYDQSQITDCSEFLVFAAWDQVTEARVGQYIQNVATTRGMDIADLDGMRAMFDAQLGLAPEQAFAWTSKQAYIALGTAVIAAAAEQVDATPMEGFVPSEVDEILGLASKGLKSAAILALGYRDAGNDWLVNLPKVRTPKEELFIRL